MNDPLHFRSDDPYEILGAPPTATAARLAKAFRKAAFRCHPDRNPGREAEASIAFQRVLSAYETLSDPARRATLDAERRRRAAAAAAARPRPASPPRPAPPRPRAAERAQAPPRWTVRVEDPPRGALRFLGLAASTLFVAIARALGFVLLAIGGPRFAVESERRRAEERRRKLPLPARLAWPLSRIALVLGILVAHYGPPGDLLDDAAARSWGVYAAFAAGTFLLLDRVAFAVLWTARAETADPLEGGVK